MLPNLAEEKRHEARYIMGLLEEKAFANLIATHESF
jgi:hypothetical protein